jgi:flagellar export protein FliJ
MKGYRFRLDSVLTLRNWEEERARTAYALALQQEHKFADQLRGVEARIEEDVAALRRPADAIVAVSARTAGWRHLLALERERNDTQQKLLSARRLRDQKMKLLIDAHRRVRILESLKSRQKQAHVAAVRQAEEKELDDLVHARRHLGN